MGIFAKTAPIFIMTPQEISKTEYISRINRVMDYIERHLDEPINLCTMAEIAHFSPFHFHRIFTLLMNETPADFIQRLRIEKAAQLLRDNPRIPIGEIACDCGFNSSSQFSRTFRKHYGKSAKEYRSMPKRILVNDGVYYSKNDQRLSKIHKPGSGKDDQICSVKHINLILMNTIIKVQEKPDMQVIYCRHTGAFNQIGKAYEKLMKWAGPRGLLGPDSHGITIYHDDPSVTEIDKVRQSACLLVNQDVKVEGEIGKMILPGGQYATGHFEIQESQFEEAWNTMCLWFTESGYEPGEGYSFEYYYNNHSGRPDHLFVLDICIPVKTL